MLALGQAVYENRTLIWGGDQPLIWELARDEWQTGARGAAKAQYGLDCDGWESGGGAFNCFFEALSAVRRVLCIFVAMIW